MNTVLLVVIAISLAVIAAAAAYTAVAAYRLYKQAMELQAQVDPQLVEFTRKQAEMTALLTRIELRQGDMTEGMDRASVSIAKLGYLVSELNTAKDRLRGL